MTSGMRRTAFGLVLAVGVAVLPVPAAIRATRVVAVGDVHGAAERLGAILRATGLIDETGAWIAGDSTTLVQVGDFTDRGSEVREVMDLLMRVERDAAAAGSRVHVLLGNHEAMNLLGDTREVTPEIGASFADAGSEARRAQAWKQYAKFAAARVRRLGKGAPPVMSHDEWMAKHPPGYLEYLEALAPDGHYGRWVRARPAIVQVEDTLFVHGGLNPDLPMASLDVLNKQIAGEIRRFDRYRRHMADRGLILPFFTFQEVVEAAVLELQAIASGRHLALSPSSLDQRHLDVLQDIAGIDTWTIMDLEGPLWFRGYARWSAEEATARLSSLLARYGASRIVVGHTIPASMRITGRFDGRVFLIDTGMLPTFYEGGRASALQIVDGKVSARYADSDVVASFTSPERPAGASVPGTALAAGGRQ